MIFLCGLLRSPFEVFLFPSLPEPFRLSCGAGVDDVVDDVGGSSWGGIVKMEKKRRLVEGGSRGDCDNTAEKRRLKVKERSSGAE